MTVSRQLRLSSPADALAVQGVFYKPLSWPDAPYCLGHVSKCGGEAAMARLDQGKESCL